MLRVLFVCSGNTCRSPMAAALFSAMGKESALPIQASSAGLAAFAGEEASAFAQQAMAQIGLDLSSHRSRPVTPYLLEESDLIVCMTQAHRRALLPFVDPEKLLLPPGGIPDPFGGDLAVYCRCRDALQAYLKTLCESLDKPVIAPMRQTDLKDLAALEQTCFSVPWSENALREELKNEAAHFFVAKRCGECAGYIGLHIAADEAYIANLAVSPNLRRRGIATELLKKAENCCREKGCAFLSLEVRRSNAPAIALYEKEGFHEKGVRKNYYSKPTEDALILTKVFPGDE